MCATPPSSTPLAVSRLALSTSTARSHSDTSPFAFSASLVRPFCLVWGPVKLLLAALHQRFSDVAKLPSEVWLS